MKDKLFWVALLLILALFATLLVGSVKEPEPTMIGVYLCTEEWSIAGTSRTLPVVYWIDDNGEFRTTEFNTRDNIPIFLNYLRGGDR